MRSRWALIGARLEAILVHNGGKYLAGPSLTYADILVAHALTWYVEEVSR
jgi:glutathione S-transferase